MTTKLPQLAKLNRPSTAGLVLRPRLFRALDAAGDGQLVWICGAPGSGKTSLASTWIESRRLRHVWYKVDAGDADPAALFHFLRIAAARIRRLKIQPLPRLTPERLPGLDVFALRFFETLFEQMARGSLLVLDDCHTVAAASSFYHVLAKALSVLPKGQSLLCISREMPPAPLARWSAAPGYCCIGSDDLRMTDREARAMAPRLGIKDAKRLNGLAKGWPAGLRLLLGARHDGLTIDEIDNTSVEPLFDYFAAEVLEARPPAIRDFLLRTAVAPWLDPDLARALTDNEDAAAILRSLHRNRLFTDRRSGDRRQAVYEYHPLFRRFLIDRGRESIPAGERLTTARETAHRLAETGHVEDAAAMLIEIDAWPELAPLVCSHAPRLAVEGRFETIGRWATAIPIENRTPWISYWVGVSEGFANPVAGRQHLEEAYKGFTAGGGQTLGRFLTLAAIFSSYFPDLGASEPIDRWINEFDALLAETAGAIPAEIESQVIGSAGVIVFRRPDHPVLRTLANRSFELARSLPTVDERLAAALFGGVYGSWTGDFGRLRALGEELGSRIESTGSWRWPSCATWLATALWHQAEHDTAFAVLDRALEVSRAQGMPVWESLLQIQIAYTALSAGDADRAERAIHESQAATHASQRAHLTQLELLRAGTMLLRHRLEEAVTIAADMLPRMAELAGAVTSGTLNIQIGQLLALGGRHDAARQPLYDALALARRMPSPILQFQALMALAWSLFDTGRDDEATSTLREALAIGSRWNFTNCHPLWIPRVMSQLCERALEAGIEPDYVRSLIRKRGLKPVSRDPRGWPWPIELRALGGFTILRDGEVEVFRGKSQHRVLDLLKAIVALGGRAVSVETLQESLWPDAEGDAAKGAFDVTLHRLRKLLGNDAALVVSSGRVGFNPAVCRVDVLTLPHALDAMEVLAHDRRATPDAATLERAADELTRQYPGHLLTGEPEYPWLLRPRERLARKFAQSVRGLGERLVHHGLHDAAVRLYCHAIEMDPEDEDLYRRVIRILVEKGNVTEALRLYARCRSSLAASGGEPSRETRSLIEAVRLPS